MASTSSTSRPWSDLPTDILLLVFENLKGNPIDLSYSARVCLSWSLAIQTLHPQPSTSPLIAYQSIDSFNQETLCLLNTQTKHIDRVVLPELRERWVRSFGHDGWFITIKLKYPHAIQLLNLITGVRINLPSPRNKLLSSSFIVLEKMRIVMSTNNPADPNCIILAIHHPFIKDLCCFWKPGDQNWTSITSLRYYGQDGEIKDAMFYNGDFYILAKFPHRPVIYLVQIKSNEKSSPIVKTFADTAFPQYLDNNNYLVEMMGELLIVSIYSRHSSKEKMKVHKLELEDGKRRWVQVKSLGKNVIYLAHFNSLSRQVSSTNNERGSCIYFLSKDTCNGCDSCVYDMLTDGLSIKPLPRPYSRSFPHPIGWYF